MAVYPFRPTATNDAPDEQISNLHTHGKAICLNMIVKNETANLERCLRSVADHISCWVIGDTGSTDGTQELIERFFTDRGIPGELHDFSFENFAQARNEALERARASALPFDYILLTDADMELTVQTPAFSQDLTAAAYLVLQNSGVTYWNNRLLRRDVPARYLGVTHEYLDVRAGETRNLEGISFIDHATGSNRVDKYERDVRLLTNAIATERDPRMIARYNFYLANTLRDSGQKEAALATYLERARLGHYHQEVFLSLLHAARLKETLEYSSDDIISAYMEATAACPTRAEALHGAARFCRDKGIYDRGFEFAAKGLAIAYPYNALFVEDWVYEYGLLDELAVNAYWTGRYAECVDACDRLLTQGRLSTDTRDRVLKNKQSALEKLAEMTVPRSTALSAVWAPDVPAAGTELMVAGLKERLGEELQRINLQVNRHGHDKADKRPRVVWMHHDVNQRWVQWCKQRELVDSVSCFVFVSYWQRDRYLNAFALPPQRCVVLRHALDLGPSHLRRWEAGSTWRCAYTSTPFRGLSVLLDAWERLSPANAELNVWSSMKLYLEDDSPYQHLYERARSMPGVIYHGLAPNPELRAALRNMHFLVYPCTFPETACLSVIEAMAAGCRVIIPSLGALAETTGGYARIYPSNPNAEEHAATFSENFAAEMATPWAGEPELSISQQAHCAAVYGWPGRLHEWRQLIRWTCGQTSQSEAELCMKTA